MHFFLSSRGGQKLSLCGFVYNTDGSNSTTGNTYWRRENRKCKGRLVTSTDQRIIKKTDHDVHGPDVPQATVASSMSRIRETARETDDAPSRIVNKELQNQFPEKFRGYWPKETTVKRSIQRQRRKKLPALPTSLKEVAIPEQWRVNSKGDRWLCAELDFEGDDKILIFCTHRNLTYLCQSSVWYGDGTFSVAPNLFYQLYTLHGVVMGQLLPLVFCIMTRKTHVQYVAMFKEIKSQAEKTDVSVNVSEFRCDFRQ